MEKNTKQTHKGHKQRKDHVVGNAMSTSRSSPEWDVLLSAAQKNWSDRIREMIVRDGVNPSHSNAVGQTALHIAALWGNSKSVQIVQQCVQLLLTRNIFCFS